MATSTTVGKIGLYLVNGVAGNEGMPGAPLLHFSLLVSTPTGTVTGQAEQTQAVAGPASKIHIGNITGHIRAAGLGKYTQLVTLQGSAVMSLPPPAIGSFLIPFHAHFAIDGAWTGVGGWSLGSHVVNDVPVHAD
jgi:hypothetical protein